MLKKVIYLLLATLFVAFAYWSLRPKRLSTQLVAVEKTVLQETLNTEGRIRAKNRETIVAFANGDLEKIDLRVGDKVKKGQVITVLTWDFDRKVVAPMDGVVTKVYREAGGAVARAEPLIEIASLDELEVSMEVLTSNATQVQVGQALTVSGWGGEPIETKVSKVSRAGFIKTSALGVDEERTEITADLDSMAPEVKSRLGDNYHVTCTVVIAEHPDALVVPLGAIFRQANQWAVFRVDRGVARTQLVSVGARNLSHVQILEGLAEGDLVINYPSDQIKDGARVLEGE